MSTNPATISAPAMEHPIHLRWLWVALAVTVAVLAVTFAVLASTGSDSDAGPVSVDLKSCPRLGTPC